jgi:ribonuclease D
VRFNLYQGVCSLTFVATFEDRTKCIIQLRDKNVNTALVQPARDLLVPDLMAVMAVEAARILHASQCLFFMNHAGLLIMMSLETDAVVAKQLAVLYTSVVDP